MMISDQEEPTPIERYWKKQFPKGRYCPLCGTDDWFSPPEGPHVLEGQPQTPFEQEEQVGWAPPVGVWPRICGDCGFVCLIVDEFVQAYVDDSDD